MIYLDYAATTPLDGEVFEVMLPYLKEDFGNADSLHAYGRKAAYAVESARERVARTLGVSPSEVYFTSGGTEADNWAVRRMGEGGVCVSGVEHRAVLDAAAAVHGSTVCSVTPEGLVTPDCFGGALTPQTGLVCVMAVNNETGSIQPLEEISALCKSRGVLLFSDCVQAAGECDLKDILTYCDAIALSAHKIYGPKGVGALIVKKGVKLRPLLTGGEQERRLRGGTLNVAGIVGFAHALEKAQREREEFSARVRALRDTFEKEVLSALGGGVKADGGNRVGGISHLTFGCGGDAFLSALDLAGVAAAAGAACSAHSQTPSHVLLAMGRSREEALRGVRFSFGRGTQEGEVQEAARIVVSCAKKRLLR